MIGRYTKYSLGGAFQCGERGFVRTSAAVDEPVLRAGRGGFIDAALHRLTHGGCAHSGRYDYVALDTALREVFKFSGCYFDCREGRVFYEGCDKNQTVIADMSGRILFAADSIMAVGEALTGETLYRFYDKESNLTGLCDADGNVRVPARFRDINSVSQGIASARLADTKKWVFINELGDIVLSGNWTGIQDSFDENDVACVALGTNLQGETEYLYIDRSGCPLGPNRRVKAGISL